jgi:cytosine/adenosine deaminase-related metal-dependent hydrolase
MAMLFQRVKGDPKALTARESLELGTLGGARVLGRTDIGSLKPGMAADFIAFDMNQIGYAGAMHDPVAALLFATSVNVSYSIINGRVVVRAGRLTTLEIEPLIEHHNRIAKALVNGD